MNALRLVRRQMNSAPEGDAGARFGERLDKARQEFKQVMDDDFNSPRGIAVLQDLTRDVNTLLNSEAELGVSTLAAIDEAYSSMGGDVLGLAPAADQASSSDGKREAALIEMLIAMRAQARADRDYARSDGIRDQLAALGILLEDRADGTIWKLN